MDFSPSIGRRPGRVRAWRTLPSGSPPIEVGHGPNNVNQMASSPRGSLSPPVAIPDEDAAIHFASQHIHITSGDELLVDFVGKLGRLHDDFRAVCRRMGAHPPDLPHTGGWTDMGAHAPQALRPR